VATDDDDDHHGGGHFDGLLGTPSPLLRFKLNCLIKPKRRMDGWRLRLHGKLLELLICG